MLRKDLLDFIKNKNKSIDEKIYNCLTTKFSKMIKSHEYYGYIITTKVGKSLDNLTINDINKSNIKEILTNLSNGIKIFINKLYDEEYLHGDIKIPNMTIKDNQIYFIDFGLTDKYDKNVTKYNYEYPEFLFNSNNQNYPIILHLFNKFFFNPTNDNFKGNKDIYIQILLDTHKTQQMVSLNPYYNAIQNLTLLFENIEEYIKQYIETLLNNLDNEKEYTPFQVYDICFKPIAKNIDIYSLSLALYQLFYNNIYQKDFTLYNIVSEPTLSLISTLYKDALNNNIENPIVLANRLDIIIDTIK